MVIKKMTSHYGRSTFIKKRLLEINNELNNQNLVSQMTMIYCVNMIYIGKKVDTTEYIKKCYKGSVSLQYQL